MKEMEATEAARGAVGWGGGARRSLATSSRMAWDVPRRWPGNNEFGLTTAGEERAPAAQGPRPTCRAAPRRPRRVHRADSCDVDGDDVAGDDVAGNRKPDDEGREFDRKGRNRTRVLRGVSSEEALVWGWKT